MRSMVVRKTPTKSFSHVTSVEISKTWSIFIPDKEHFKQFMKKMGVSIIGGNQCFTDVVCLNNWLGSAADRTLFHVQSLEKDLNDGKVACELDRLCAITPLQFLELLKIHGRNRQYCGLNTDGKTNVVYVWPSEMSSYSDYLCVISFCYIGGITGGWVLNGMPVGKSSCARNKGTRVISRCFAQDSFPK